MAQVNILDSVRVSGEEALSLARAEVRKFKLLKCKVPVMRVRGDWTMAGFDFSFDEWVDAFPPIGNMYIKAGPKKAQVAPTATSEIEVFFVHTGEGITDKNPLASGDLFAGIIEEPEDDEEPTTDSSPTEDDAE